jgi:WD40 repeat protein
VTTFAWHPTRKILAVGWESGDVLVWNEHDHELHEASSLHNAAVRIIEWSLNGSRLVSGDEVCGHFCIKTGILIFNLSWKIEDSRKP